MNEQNYTSLELSKKLHEAGCELRSSQPMNDSWWVYEPNGGLRTNGFKWQLRHGVRTMHKEYSYVPAYDILWDICVRYSRQFFGEEDYYCYECRERILDKDGCQNMRCETDNAEEVACLHHSLWILELLQQGKKQEAEDYIWEHCLFNCER